jgi:DNA helicase HerA-like ATPase
MSDGIIIGQGDQPVVLLPKYGNRHGLIAGATGTGKTVTLQRIAEGFSNIGVPVFVADVKGDLSGISQPGGGNPKIEDRFKQLGMPGPTYAKSPTIFWDLYGEKGHPIRGTVSDMGPLLLSRMLQLNDVQEGVLNAVFQIADDKGLLLLDLKDLRAMLANCAQNAADFRTTYGNITSTSVGAVQRNLLVLEQQGADRFFGEPKLDLNDLMLKSHDGRGAVSVLSAQKLMQNPNLYATFLLWMMSELFENLPEVGDLPQPKLVFVFDEAHLLFNDAPKALIDRVEQVVRLIRSKGVGIYFVTQNPLDVPDIILGQLSNRVQHALRAFTPRDQKAVDAAATTFRQNPKLKVSEVITQLLVGEALVSMLDEQGAPTVVERAFIQPPLSRIGAITDEELKATMGISPVGGKYDQAVDRQSAYEMLTQRTEEATQQAQYQMQNLPGAQDPSAYAQQRTYQHVARIPRQPPTVLEQMASSAARAASSQIGRSIVRGVLGSIFKGL